MLPCRAWWRPLLLLLLLLLLAPVSRAAAAAAASRRPRAHLEHVWEEEQQARVHAGAKANG
jgi:hypothetical protein